MSMCIYKHIYTYVCTGEASWNLTPKRNIFERMTKTNIWKDSGGFRYIKIVQINNNYNDTNDTNDDDEALSSKEDRNNNNRHTKNNCIQGIEIYGYLFENNKCRNPSLFGRKGVYGLESLSNIYKKSSSSHVDEGISTGNFWEEAPREG
jgi:hypothetical protein